jgi:hypothetical protein
MNGTFQKQPASGCVSDTLQIVRRRFGFPAKSLCLAIVLSATGCDRGPAPPPLNVKTYPLKGKLLVGGKPARNATIMFYPIHSQAASPTSLNAVDAPRLLIGATANSDGEFEVRTNGINDGLPEGKYRLAASWPDPKVVPNRDGDREGKDLIPQRYRAPETSGLEVTVPSLDGAPLVLELAGK